MRWRYVLKVLARSRSLGFAVNAASNRASSKIATLRWRGRDVCYRPGTSDASIIYQHLLRSGPKAEYYLPRTLDPKIVVELAATSARRSSTSGTYSPAQRSSALNRIPKHFHFCSETLRG